MSYRFKTSMNTHQNLLCGSKAWLLYLIQNTKKHIQVRNEKGKNKNKTCCPISRPASLVFEHTTVCRSGCCVSISHAHISFLTATAGAETRAKTLFLCEDVKLIRQKGNVSYLNALNARFAVVALDVDVNFSVADEAERKERWGGVPLFINLKDLERFLSSPFSVN